MTKTARQIATRKKPTELRRLRLLHALKAGTVAEAIRIDASYLSLMERGKRKPSLAVAQRIAAFYERSIEEVFPSVGIKP